MTTAFLLGWSVSETLGLVRKGLRPSPRRERPPNYAPRLAVSEGFPQRSTDAMLVSVERVVYLHQALFGAEPVSPLSRQVLELPQEARAWLHGERDEFYPPRDLRQLLNDWTLEVWAKLGGLSPDSAQAFAAGMSLADTYWYLRAPGRRPQSPPEPLGEENWRRLLSPYRLLVERSRLLRLRRNLPPYVVDVIRSHLQAWSIGTGLDHRDGQLVLLSRAESRTPLPPDDEAKLQQALARQVLYWNAMLFGFREATTYLLGSDRWLIRAARTIGLVLTLLVSAIVLVLALAAVGYLLIVGVVPFVQPLLSQFLAGQPLAVSDVLSLANLAWTVLIALRLPQLVGVSYRAGRNVEKWLDERLTVDLVARRTYVPWNRFLVKRESERR